MKRRWDIPVVQSFSFSANPSTQWQATRDVEVEEEKKASRAFGVPPNAEESGGCPNPLENAEENEASKKKCELNKKLNKKCERFS